MSLQLVLQAWCPGQAVGAAASRARTGARPEDVSAVTPAGAFQAGRLGPLAVCTQRLHFPSQSFLGISAEHLTQP